MSRLRLVAAAAALLLGATAWTAVAESLENPTVTTDAGDIEGVVDDGVTRYHAVPYAAAPTGDRRWRPPEPAAGWDGVRDATRPGPVCPQPGAPDMPTGLPQSEDCLTVDVTVPDTPGTDRPVMVWIPGGGFVTGAGSIYDPARLVTEGDMVVVTVNYRLGVFGFFDHPDLGEANFGLQDQIAALRWVSDNIAGFGGDADRVTLAGASAGAMSACTLMTSRQADGLFQRAIVQSGSCGTEHPAGAIGEGVGAVSSWQPAATVQDTGAALAADLSCGDLDCLRDKRVDELLPYTGMFPLIGYGTDLVPREPAEVFDAGEAAPIPLLQGNVADEHVEFMLGGYGELTEQRYAQVLSTAFGSDASAVAAAYPAADHPSPIAAAGRVFSDQDWICPSVWTSRSHSARAPVYTYLFDDPSAPTPGGQPLPDEVRPATPHGGDMVYLFDFDDGFTLTDAQRVLADQMVGYWSRFVATGDPNGAGAARWPGTTPADPVALGLESGGIAPVDVLAERNCSLWK